MILNLVDRVALPQLIVSGAKQRAAGDGVF
jgi:hypothetical protein